MPGIKDVEGIGPKYAEKLKKAGVRSTDKLLEKGATPALDAPGWSVTLPTTFIFAGLGPHNLYAWVMDAAGNLSTMSSATTSIVGVARIGAIEYPTLNTAYQAAPDQGVTTILTVNALLNESLTVNKLLKIIGGHNLNYSGRTGQPTELQGILTIGIGSLTVDGLAVK